MSSTWTGHPNTQVKSCEHCGLYEGMDRTRSYCQDKPTWFSNLAWFVELFCAPGSIMGTPPPQEDSNLGHTPTSQDRLGLQVTQTGDGRQPWAVTLAVGSGHPVCFICKVGCSRLPPATSFLAQNSAWGF